MNVNIMNNINEEDDMRPEYDFSAGIRGKHYKAMKAGYNIKIHQADGSIITKEVSPCVITLEPDVQAYFPDSETVNATLRALIRLIPST
jgi:hypothetical protein